MTDELLPALPRRMYECFDEELWTAKQMRAYAREAIRMAQEWRPIETCPKGEVLLFWPENKPNNRGHNALSAMMRVDRNGSTPFRLPTHWQPLPAPPAGEVA